MDDVNEILAEVNSGTEQSAPEQVEQPAEQTPQEQFYEYTARGKTIREPIDKILQRASQGYDYSQLMGEFNKQREEFDGKYKLYQEVDSYAQQNPQWWDFVQQQYTSRGQQAPQEQAPNGQAADPLDKFKSEIDELRKFKDEILAERTARQREEEDQRLKQEVESIQGQYKDIDFSAKDESGKSLEARVLEHAINNNIASFKTAFLDFYHDKLVSRAREQAKEEAQKELQKKTKLGLLGKSPTPIKSVERSSDLKNRSYEDLLEDALQELGINN